MMRRADVNTTLDFCIEKDVIDSADRVSAILGQNQDATKKEADSSESAKSS